MFKLDNNFLNSLGLGALPVDEKNKLLQAIYERLEMNVGMKLAEGMTDAQMGEFEGFIDRKDEAGALGWLESNFPNYKQVVADELGKLKDEISQAAPHILAAAQQQAVVNPVVGGGSPVPVQPQSVQNTQIQPQRPFAQAAPTPQYQSPPAQAAPQYQSPNQSGHQAPQQPSAESVHHQADSSLKSSFTPPQDPNQSASPQIPAWPSQQPPPGPGL